MLESIARLVEALFYKWKFLNVLLFFALTMGKCELHWIWITKLHTNAHIWIMWEPVYKATHITNSLLLCALCAELYPCSRHDKSMKNNNHMVIKLDKQQLSAISNFFLFTWIFLSLIDFHVFYAFKSSLFSYNRNLGGIYRKYSSSINRGWSICFSFYWPLKKSSGSNTVIFT